MAVKIRLQRHGTKHAPTYRLVVADARSPRDGRFVEILGTFNPRANRYEDELRLKLDAVPGLTGMLHFKPEKVGTYEIVCAELCGLGHYKMRSYLDVMELADYEKWLAEQASYLE